MTRSLRVEIGNPDGTFTDYGPLGQNIVESVQWQVSSAGNIATATINMGKPAGSDVVVLPRAEVRIYEWESGGGGYIARALYGGFVAIRETWRIKGTTRRKFSIPCQDYNILLDEMGIAFGLPDMILQGFSTFSTLVQTALCWVTLNAATGTPTIDKSLGLANASTSYLWDVDYNNMSLRAILDDLVRLYIKNVGGVADTSPIYFIGVPPAGSPIAVWGKPTLRFYESADLLASPQYKFSDNPGAPYKSIYSFRRRDDGIDLRTGVTAYANHATGGYYSKRVISGITSGEPRDLYPNNYDHRVIGGVTQKTWEVLPSIGLQDETPNADVDFAANTTLSRQQIPRETVELVSDDTAITNPPQPGALAWVTWALDGLSDTPYVVASTDGEYLVNGIGGLVRWSMQLGNALLYLGQTAVNFNHPVRERDTALPAPPTSITGTWTFPGGGARLSLTGTNSITADVYQYKYYVTICPGGINCAAQPVVYGPVTNPPTVPFIFYPLPLGCSGSVYVTCIDRSGNESIPSNTYTWTNTDTTPGLAPPTSLTKTLIPAPSTNSYDLIIEMTASGSPSLHHYKFYASGLIHGPGPSLPWSRIEIGPNPPVLKNMIRGVPYNSSGSCYAVSVDQYGNESSASGTITWVQADTRQPPVYNWQITGNGLFTLGEPTLPTVPLYHAVEGDVAIAATPLLGFGTVQLNATIGTDAILIGPPVATYDPYAFYTMRDRWRIQAFLSLKVIASATEAGQVIYLEAVCYDADDVELGTILLDSIDLDDIPSGGVVRVTNSYTLSNLLALPLDSSAYFKPQARLSTSVDDATAWVSGGYATTAPFILPLPVVDSDGHALVNDDDEVIWEYADH